MKKHSGCPRSFDLRTLARAATIAVLAMLVVQPAVAGPNQNEVAAFLVYPAVLTEVPGTATPAETWLKVTNYGNDTVQAHVTFVNGESGSPTECYECDFTITLDGGATETIFVRQNFGGTELFTQNSLISLSCNWPRGFITISTEDLAGNTTGDNVLAGEQIFVDYTNGRSFSTKAIPIQGLNVQNSDRNYDFNDLEYSKLPRVIAFEFTAPDFATDFNTYVALFTLGFQRQFPPLSDCSVTGYDANANPFSRSHQFGCWDLVELGDLSPEFEYPNLGFGPTQDEYGWLQLNCRVDQDGGGPAGFSDGGVMGLIFSQAPTATVPFGRPDAGPPALAGPAAWGRLGKQSVTDGDSVTLQLN